mmetsp:Transcript_30994/g.96432  ORF Transcript_30994/g.96432 Transcript_30994/m.96432 type:complete len:255 (+) Transcript_30994:291-1055(+)
MARASPFCCTAASTMPRSPRSCWAAARRAWPRCCTARSTTAGSARNSGAANASALPLWLTAASTTSRSSVSSLDAKLSKSPFFWTAASITSRSASKFADAKRTAPPLCFKPAKITSRSAFTDSGADARNLQFCPTFANQAACSGGRRRSTRSTSPPSGKSVPRGWSSASSLVPQSRRCWVGVLCVRWPTASFNRATVQVQSAEMVQSGPANPLMRSRSGSSPLGFAARAIDDLLGPLNSVALHHSAIPRKNQTA